MATSYVLSMWRFAARHPADGWGVNASPIYDMKHVVTAVKLCHTETL